MALFFCCNSNSEDYEKLADAITTETSQKLQAEKGLCLIGTGGRMMDDIKMMSMSFEFFHPIDVQQGRQLLIFSINEYLRDINNNEKIRSYLNKYPFTEKNIEIHIWIRNPDGSMVSLDKIYYISAIDGVLTYYIDDPERFSRKIVYRETYAEALSKFGHLGT